MAHDHDNQRGSKSILATVTALALAVTCLVIAASNDDNVTVQGDHRQLALDLVDSKTVSPRIVEYIISQNAAGEEIGSEACKSHIMFSTFRCFEDSSACTPLRQRIEENTFKVWSSFPEEVTFKAIHSSKLESNEYGVPILKNMYLNMMEECPNALTYTYINGDIIGTHAFIDSINAALSVGKDFLMVGKRFNVQWHESWDVEAEDLDWINKPGKLFRRYAEDYFTVTKNAIDWETIPPLVIGRIGYDNWLVDHAYHKSNVVLVDATYSAKMVHQTERSNRSVGGDTVNADRNYNINILQEAGLEVGDHGFTTNAEYQTSPTNPISIRHRRAWSYENAKENGYDSE